ncbi:MAG TPA: hypothetical protein VF911_21105 [Thermoanaerobaculia bacterium]
MKIGKSFAAAFVCVIAFARVAFGACPADRAPVKAASDAQAAQISLLALPATIESLHAMPKVRPLPQESRVAPAETTIHSVTATLMAYRLTPESEIELVLSDEARRTILAYIPSPSCIAGSAFAFEIERARAEFEQWYRPTDTFTEVRGAVEVQGAGLFDFLQGQRGAAPNGLALYPVTAIDFTPSWRPKPPPAPPARRRSVGSGGGTPRCAPPTLTITTSRPGTCAGEQVSVSWSASDSAATVTIEGIGAALPASGTRSVPIGSGTIFSGSARTSCAVGPETFAVVTLTPGASASIAGPPSLTTGSSTSLSISVFSASSWTLTSSLGNTITPKSGASSQSVVYQGNHVGTDTVTLATTGGACANVTKTHTIMVSAAPPTGGLRCCDGTRSPTCFSCSDKRGCCSGHQGVCGCGN